MDPQTRRTDRAIHNTAQPWGTRHGRSTETDMLIFRSNEFSSAIIASLVRAQGKQSWGEGGIVYKEG